MATARPLRCDLGNSLGDYLRQPSTALRTLLSVTFRHTRFANGDGALPDRGAALHRQVGSRGAAIARWVFCRTCGAGQAVVEIAVLVTELVALGELPPMTTRANSSIVLREAVLQWQSR